MNEIILYSAISTGVAEILTLSICTTKTVFQSSLKNTSIIKTVKDIYYKTGILGFYKGTTPAFTAQILSSTLKISFYTFLTQKYTSLNYCVAGILSAVFTTLFTHPLDVLRITFQNNNKIIPFLYKGWTKSFYKGVIGGATFLPIRSFIKEKNPNLKSFEVNFISSIISTVLVTPVDYYKTYIISNNDLSKISHNPFKGLSLNLLRIVPHFTIMMTLFDYFISF